jgi:hypothetical protein
MTQKIPFIKTYLRPEEYERLTSQAQNAGLSNSRYLKMVALGQEVRNLVDQKAYLALLKSKADLGRLGGLLKHHLELSRNQPRNEQPEWRRDLFSLLRSIEMTQNKVGGYITDVSRDLLRGKKR